MLHVLIADDELMARRRLARNLAMLDGVVLMAECEDGQQALARLRQGGIDVAILDVQMSGLSGLDVASLLNDPELYVILVTAYPEHALEAFDVGAVDHLLKPVELGRLQQALDRARKSLEVSVTPTLRVASRSLATTLRRLTISTREGLVLVDPHEIYYAVLEYELVKLVTASRSMLITDNLKTLEERLDSEDFVRVHRQSIIHMRYLQALMPLSSGGYTARMINGDEVNVSRQAGRRLRTWPSLDD